VRTIAARGTDQILVVCYRQGHFELTTGGETRRVEAGQLAFIDLSQPVAIAAPSVDNICLAVSRRKLEAAVPFLDGAHGFVRPEDALSKLLRGMLEEIVAVGPTLSVVDARGIAAAALQLVVACLEPLSRQPVDGGRNTVSLVSIRAFIEQHLLDPTLEPKTLIEAFGTTRSTLYRLFEPLGGVSAYIAQRRLYHAFRLLSDTRTPRGRISKLATELGYSHPSGFTRAFKDTFGLSPKDVQALAEQSREQDVQLLTSPEPLLYLRPIADGPRLGATRDR
jgi:AraC-like DNA-binding protein